MSSEVLVKIFKFNHLLKGSCRLDPSMIGHSLRNRTMTSLSNFSLYCASLYRRHFVCLQSGSSIHCQQAILTLKQVKTSHVGEYIFIVRSARGLAEGSLTLNVTRASGYSVSSIGLTKHTNSHLYLFIFISFFIYST